MVIYKGQWNVPVAHFQAIKNTLYGTERPHDDSRFI